MHLCSLVLVIILYRILVSIVAKLQFCAELTHFPAIHGYLPRKIIPYEINQWFAFVKPLKNLSIYRWLEAAFSRDTTAI